MRDSPVLPARHPGFDSSGSGGRARAGSTSPGSLPGGRAVSSGSTLGLGATSCPRWAPVSVRRWVLPQAAGTAHPTCCTARGSSTSRPPRSMPRCARSRRTSAPRARCIACSPRPTKCASGAPRPGIRSRDLFAWYNDAHHHSGLSYLTPADVHYGRAATVLAARHRTRLAAYAAHPERFVQGPPRPESLPTAVWINRPPTHPSQAAPSTTTVTPNDLQPGVMGPPPRIDDRPGTLVTSVESLQ